MDKNNPVLDKSKAFAVRIIRLYQYLDGKRIYALASQIVRSGTSIGANVREAVRGQSKADFYAKLGIALKEAEETAYWLELLFESGYIEDNQFNSLYRDCKELVALLTSILKTRKGGN
ncbi:MAG: four helix bundle protein [Oscillospiraceae bacterium]|nr:four helix bundle protein [Oscillospiraceae bacterium]